MPHFHRVLIAETGTASRHLIASMLRPHADQLAFASHLDEALAELDGSECDLVVAEVELPGGGLGLLDRICSQTGPRPAVVMLTRDPNLDEEAQVSLAGAIGYLRLPLELDQLATLLRSLRRGADTRRGGGADR
jgi:DNA-binding response OmpR family regulator